MRKRTRYRALSVSDENMGNRARGARENARQRVAVIEERYRSRWEILFGGNTDFPRSDTVAKIRRIIIVHYPLSLRKVDSIMYICYGYEISENK